MTLHVGSVGPPIRANTMEPEVFRQAFLIATGVRSGILQSTDFVVTQNGSPNMSVNVAAGWAVIPGTASFGVQGSYNLFNDATVNVALTASNGSNPRIDIICLTINDVYYGSGTNTPVLQVVTGTPAASPAVPATPANSLVLAHVYVGTSVTSITNSNINVTTGTGNPDVYAFAPMRAQGLQAYKIGASGTITSVAAPGTLVPGLSAVCNIGAGRNIRIRGSVSFETSAAAAVPEFFVYIDGTLVGGTQFVQPAGVSGFTGMSIDWIDSGRAAGVHQYQIQAFSNAAQTLTFFANGGILTVEDAGPV